MSDDIDITGCDLRVLIAKAYALSPLRDLTPVYPAYTGDGELTEDEVTQILTRGEDDPLGPVCMDDEKDRAVKLRVFARGDRLYIRSRWPLHTDSQLTDLCTAIGVKRTPAEGDLSDDQFQG